MKLVHPGLTMQFDFEKECVKEWVIESPELFYQFTQEMNLQCSGQEGKFILSHNNKECPLSRKMEFISSPFSVDLEDKKLLSKLYESLKELAYDENNFAFTQEVNQGILQYILELEGQTNHVLMMNQEIDLSCLFKAAGVKFEEGDGSLLETIFKYIELVNDFLKKEIVILVNFRSYLNDEQMKELIKMVQYREISVLLIENFQRDCIEGCKQYIIDCDQCEIY